MTIIYNIQSGQVESWHDPRYLVMGEPGLLHEDVVELTVEYNQSLQYNPVTEICIESWQADIAGGVYRQVWNISYKDEQTIESESIAQADAVDQSLDPVLIKELLLNEVAPQSAEEMLAVASLFPAWRPGETVQAEARRQYNEVLYRCVQGHTTQAGWTPDITPALWVVVSPAGTIHNWVQPAGAHDAYNLGDHVMYNGQEWVSTINSNVWAPGVYGWTIHQK